jgi:hypothetical protein
MTATVKITKDRLEEVQRAVLAADEFEVLVGFPEGGPARLHDTITNAELAYIHDRGAPAANIPARPFLEPGINNAIPIVDRIAKAAIRTALDTGNVAAIRQGLDRMGHAAVGEVQRKIATGPFVPLAPATIAAKGSSTPLIDTAQMRQAVSYEVRRKS